jgi:hypothetical protein
VALGEGDGWFDGMQATTREEALEVLADIGTQPVEYLACVTGAVKGTVTYHLDDAGAASCTFQPTVAA